MPLHCLHCHESGHSLSSCPSHPSQRRPCWSCGQNGHRAAKCPNRRPIVVKPITDPPMSPSSSTSTATSHSSESDVSMLSSDYSPLEAHNDMIISDYISKYRSDDAKPTTELYKPAMPTDTFDSTVRKYPMSDEAKKILRTLPTSVAIKLRLHDQPFPSATISSVSSGSVSSTMFKDT